MTKADLYKLYAILVLIFSNTLHLENYPLLDFIQFICFFILSIYYVILAIRLENEH